jgi:hypothetical protein
MASSNEIIAGRVAVQVRGDNSQLKKDVAESESVFKTLKKNLGEESTLGNVAKAIRGAGAIAGIGAIAFTLERATTRARELQSQFNEGKINAREMGVELAKSIPVLGSIVTAGENINDWFTGNKTYLETVQQQDALHASILEKMRAMREHISAIAEDTASFTAGMAKTVERLNMSGLPLKLFDIDAETSKQIEEIKKWAKEQKKTKDIQDQEKAIADSKLKRGALYNEFAKKQADFVEGSKWGPQDPSRLMAAAKAVDDMEATIARQRDALSQSLKAIDDQAAARISAVSRVQGMQRSDAAAEESSNAWKDFYDDLSRRAKAITTTPITEFMDRVRELDFLLKRAAINQDQYNGSIKKYRADLLGDTGAGAAGKAAWDWARRIIPAVLSGRIKATKEIASNSLSGSAFQLAGISTGRSDGTLNDIHSVVKEFYSMVARKLPVDTTLKAT